jgi:predicted DNA-binding transcriptional regulator AlpA
MTPHLYITAPKSVDPLLTAIRAYRDGLELYGKAIGGKDDWLDDDGELLAALVYKPGSVLEKWRAPASSHEVALAAISLAELEKADSKGSAISDAMEAAAIAYWKCAGPSAAPIPADSAAPISLNDTAPDTLLRAQEAAAYLRVSLDTLARWRCTKRGPAFVKIGGNVAYRVSALRDFISSRERKGTRPQK